MAPSTLVERSAPYHHRDDDYTKYATPPSHEYKNIAYATTSSLVPTTYTLNLVGTTGVAMVIGVIIYDFLAYCLSMYKRSDNGEYAPYGRRMVKLASQLWNRQGVAADALSPLLARARWAGMCVCFCFQVI